MAASNSPQKDTDQLSNEIIETRARMGRTLNTLEYKLNPQRLKQQAADKVRSETVGRVENLADDASRKVKGAGNDVFETIKENPIPAALVALGLGWLFMERRSQGTLPEPRGAGGDYNFGYTYQTPDQRRRSYGQDWRPGYQQPGMGSQLSDRAQQMGSQVQDKAQQVAGQVQDRAQQVTGQVQDKAQQVAGQVQDTAQQVAGQVQDQVSDWSDTAQYQASRVRSRFEDMLDENPLLIGAAAAALGLAIGMSIPATPQEDQLFGQHRDRLMDKAQETASDTMDKVQTVAQRAGDAAKQAAKDEAQKQNLTSQTGF